VVHIRWPDMMIGGLPCGTHPTTIFESWRLATWHTSDGQIRSLEACHVAPHPTVLDKPPGRRMRDIGWSEMHHLAEI
jgi:hypothetical protein